MSLLPRRYVPVPDYIPAGVAARISGRSFSFKKLPQVVKRRMRTAKKIRVSEHAAKYRKVTDGAHIGPWRHEYAPHTVKIMDTYSLPWVREIWFCGVEQSGKTNTMLNCMHWAADCDPGDIFYLMPTEDTSAKITGGKIRPMIQNSSRLSRFLSGRQDDITLSRVKLNHGVTIRPAHANSPASMATWPAKHCFGDEVDKYPEQAGREADPITLIRKRNRVYKGRYKRFFASTPAQLFIFEGMRACAQVWEFRVRCPHCDQLIKMEAEHLDLDGMSIEDVEAGAKVLYTCHECGSQWDDETRERAIRFGTWVCVKGEDIIRPTRVGFHHRAFECLDVPMAEIAVAWLKGEKGTLADKIAWANGYAAEDYKFESQDRAEDFILRLRDDSLPRKVVPVDTSMLVILADTQRIGIHYEVWAFGWGSAMDVAMIDHGFLQTFTQLMDVSRKEWQNANGKIYRIQVGFIDSGGGTDPNRPKHTRTVQVYDFCRRNPLFRPLKGRRTMETGWNVKRQDFYPSSVGKKVPIPGGLLLYTINVTLYKNELAGKLQIERDDPGALRLHAEVTSDYAKQMCAEYQDDRGYWICPKGKDNHHWDIAVYGMAAADILGIRRMRQRTGKPGVKVYSKGVQA